MSNLPPYEIRPATHADRGYVIETWLQSYRKSQSPWAKQLPNWAYWSRYGHVGLVEDIAQRCNVVVACLPESPEFIYGWAAFEGDTLHYVFTRHDFRSKPETRMGFASALLTAAEIGESVRVSHLTPEFSRWLGKGRRVEFVNPYRSEQV